MGIIELNEEQMGKIKGGYDSSEQLEVQKKELEEIKKFLKQKKGELTDGELEEVKGGRPR